MENLNMKSIVIHGIKEEEQNIFCRALAEVRGMTGTASIVLLGSRQTQWFFSIWARLRRKKIIWVIFPEADTLIPTGLLGWVYRRTATWATIIVFSKESQDHWLQAIPTARVRLVLPASLDSVALTQHDLFKALAGTRGHRFVIAAAVRNLDKNRIERLLGALSIALSICPIMELIIVGEGENRKALQWLLRKMNLSNHVWLVGDAAPLARFLDHVDVFVVASERPHLDDIADLLIAMGQGVAVLGPQAAGLNDIITAKTGALIDISDSETLARQLLRLQQDETLCRALGREAEIASRVFTFSRFCADLNKIISEI